MVTTAMSTLMPIFCLNFNFIFYFILGYFIFHFYLSTGRPKKNYYFTFCLIFHEPNNKIANRFFLLKTEIHMHILNTKPFLYDSRGLRCLRYKMGVLTHKFINKMTHNGPNSLKVTSSCPDQPLTDIDWPWQSPSDPMKH